MEIFLYILVGLAAMAVPAWIVVAVLIISLALEGVTGGASTFPAFGAFLVLVIKYFIR